LTFPGLVETLRAAFREGAAAGQHIIRSNAGWRRLTLRDAGLTYSVRPAAAGGHIGVKIVTVSPDNYVGKPAVMGLPLLDGATGEPEALIDGQRLTQWRTACASALAASYLAREDARARLWSALARCRRSRQGAAGGAAIKTIRI
jgi:ornithine cyclodeaminase